MESHPDLLGPDTMTVEELRDLTELSAAWQRKRLLEAEDADDAWTLSDGPSLIVSGRRP